MKPETWTGPKAEAESHADRLGYPVVVDGRHCRLRVEALKAIEGAGDSVTVSRPGGEGAAMPVQGNGKGKPKPGG